MKNTTIIKLVLSVLACISLSNQLVGMETDTEKKQEIIKTGMTGTLFFLEDSAKKYLFIEADDGEYYSAFDPDIDATQQKQETFSKLSHFFFGKKYNTPEDLVGKKVKFNITGKKINLQNKSYPIAKIISAIPANRQTREEQRLEELAQYKKNREENLRKLRERLEPNKNQSIEK